MPSKKPRGEDEHTSFRAPHNCHRRRRRRRTRAPPPPPLTQTYPARVPDPMTTAGSLENQTCYDYE